MRTARRCSWLAVLACAPIGAAVAAESVVLESNAPMYAPGQTLDAAATIILAERQFIVVATDDGRLMRVEGPHAGPASGAPPAASALREAIGRLLGREAPELGGLGGVRGPDDVEIVRSVSDSRHDPWSIHAGLTGDQCFIANRPPQVWRETAGSRASAEITALATGQAARIDWPSEQQLTAWPAELAPEDGQIYLIRVDAAVRSVAVRLHALQPAMLEQTLASAAWLAAKACASQAELLLRRNPDITIAN